VLLIGTFPGASYFLHHGPETKAWFTSLLDWAGVRQQVRVSDAEIKARLHTGPGGNWLWVVNPTRASRKASVTLRDGKFTRGKDVWGSATPEFKDQTVTVALEDRNVAVIKLDR
jgi:hypothetical protein